MNDGFNHLTRHFQLPVPDIRAALGGGALRAVHLHFQRIDPHALQRGRRVSERDAALKRENADLRRKVTNLEALLADAEYRAARAEAANLSHEDGIATARRELAQMEKERQQQDEWELLPTLMRLVPEGIVSRGTPYNWCAMGKVEAKQWGLNGSEWMVRRGSLWNRIEFHARRYGKEFKRPTCQ